MFTKTLQAAALVALGLTAGRAEAAPVPKTPAGADEKAKLDALADIDSQLLMNRKVLKDVRCDFDQFDKIMDLMEAAQLKSQAATNAAFTQLKLNPNAGNIAPEAFEKMARDAQEAGEKEFRKAVAGVVKDVLSPAQRKRLREIDLQSRGHEALTTPAVAKVLDLTAKQKEQIAACAKQVNENINGGLQKQIGPDGAVVFDFEKVVRDARADGMKRALAVLTDDQKAMWKAMTGAAFTHPLNRPWHGNGGVFFGGGNAPAVDLPLKIIPAVDLLPAKPPQVDPGK